LGPGFECFAYNEPWKTTVAGCRIWKRRSGISGSIFDVAGKQQELAQIEQRLADPTIWDDPSTSRPILKRRRRLQQSLELAEGVKSALEDIQTLLELESEGEEVGSEITKELGSLEPWVDKVEVQTLLSGEHDANDAILTIHPGAGGTESQDWAEMLARMYLRWAEQSGHKTEITDYQVGEEAGIKSVTLLVRGDYAYGHLSAEIGVHRLVRISPYDAGARRHTSFASVFVTPEVEEESDLEIEDKDLRIDTYRSSGAGGQHVNVTDSAVRITHLPTNIVVQCQNERSQHRNKDMAMRILKSKLFERELAKRQEKLDEMEDGKADIAWGSQIRSYVLHPYRMAKDHRTKLETGNVDAVLDGDIGKFITEALKLKTRNRVQREGAVADA